MPVSGLGSHLGTGGFMNPEKIVSGFVINEGMMIADLVRGRVILLFY